MEISDSSEVSITLEYKAPAHGPHPSIPGLKTLETKPSPVQHKLNPSRISRLMRKNAKEALQNKFPNMSYLQDPTNTLMLKTYQRSGIGEMSMEPIGFHGAETSTFPSTVAAAGLMLLQVPLPTESTSPETEHGQIFPYRLKF